MYCIINIWCRIALQGSRVSGEEGAKATKCAVRGEGEAERPLRLLTSR